MLLYYYNLNGKEKNMKKKMMVLLLLIVTALASFSLVACGEDETPAVNYGTLTIEDVTVEQGKIADLNAVFSVESAVSEITYTFDGNNISISNGRVSGLVAGTQTTVTAKTAHHTATFKVTVTEINYGEIVINAPDVIYTNYAGKAISASFTVPQYAGAVTWSIDKGNLPTNAEVTIANGKISATGLLGAHDATTQPSYTVTVKAQSATNDLSAEKKIKIAQYNGAGYQGASLKLEQRIAGFISENKTASGEEEGAKGGTLFVGDSFFDGFFGTFANYYANKNAFRWGVSSSTLSDWLIISERVVYPFEPANIVVTLGTNDYYDDGKSANQIITMAKELVNAYHANVPNAKVYYFGIAPRKLDSGAVRDGWSEIKKVNAALSEYAEANDWLVFIDTAPWCFTDDAQTTIKTSFYKDNVHPSDASYALYVQALSDAGMVVKGFENAEKYGTLTIADIEVGKGKTVTIRPEFSMEEYEDEPITYTFNGDDIKITSGKVKGMVADTETTVTATTKYHSTTFKVKVVDYGKITVTAGKSELTLGETTTLSVAFTKPEYAGEVSYSCYPADALEIDENGNVTALKSGEITVTASSAQYGISGFCVIKVESIFEEIEVPTYYYINHPAKAYSFTMKGGYSASDVTVTASTVAGATISVSSGKIYATGSIGSAVNNVEYLEKDLILTFTHEKETITKTVKLRQYEGVGYNGGSLGLSAKAASREKTLQDKQFSENGTIFVGDSFFDTGFWSNFYTESYKGKDAVTVGVSSSTISDWIVISERLVYPYNPANVVFHCGTNDLHDDKLNADQTLALAKQLLEDYHKNMPTTKVYYFNVEPRRTSGTSNQARDTWAKCKAFNEALSEYAKDKDWLVVIDSASWCFTDASQTTIDTTFYKTGDATHPSVASYAKYVKALEDNGLEVPASQAVVNKTIADIQTIFKAGGVDRYDVIYAGSNLTKEFVISGKLDITQSGSNAHIELFSFNNGRLLLWDDDSNGSFGVGWLGGVLPSGGSPAAPFFTFTAGSTLTLSYVFVIDDKNAYLYINDNLELIVYNISANPLKFGAEATVVKNYDIVCKTKADDEAEYTALLAQYKPTTLASHSGVVVERVVKQETGGDETVTTKIDDISLAYTDKVNRTQVYYGTTPLTKEYVISGKLDITQSGTNAHIELFRFNSSNRFLLWDDNGFGGSVSDNTFGIGWAVNNAYTSPKSDATTMWTFDGTKLTLSYVFAVDDKNAYLYIEGDLIAIWYNIPSDATCWFGAEKTAVKNYDIVCKTKANDASEYAELIAQYKPASLESTSSSMVKYA